MWYNYNIVRGFIIGGVGEFIIRGRGLVVLLLILLPLQKDRGGGPRRAQETGKGKSIRCSDYPKPYTPLALKKDQIRHSLSGFLAAVGCRTEG